MCLVSLKPTPSIKHYVWKSSINLWTAHILSVYCKLYTIISLRIKSQYNYCCICTNQLVIDFVTETSLAFHHAMCKHYQSWAPSCQTKWEERGQILTSHCPSLFSFSRQFHLKRVSGGITPGKILSDIDACRWILMHFGNKKQCLALSDKIYSPRLSDIRKMGCRLVYWKFVSLL